MLLLIPLLPFIGFLFNVTVGRRLSKTASGGVASGVMALSFGVAASEVWALLHAEPTGGVRAIEQQVSTWIASGGLNVPLTFRLDPLSSLMVLVVTGIGTLIHLYSTAYMHDESDAEFGRYFSYLNLFAAFMLVLVLGASFPVMFIGWEGVGLCSYLLIGFWFTKPSAAAAGKKAFVVNRIGDFGFVLAMLWLFKLFGTLDFQQVAAKVSAWPNDLAFGALTGITLLLFLGATGKSAQIPLYVWLPDAMEGPTPVSALIHAATMVTAGVYMIGRNAVLFSHAPHTMEVVAVIGCITALMAGTIGLVQNDIKRVLAYSTVSQLGYMFLAMGVGAFAGGIFHLYTHAFFKALLFLGSGAVIHALHGEQDLRHMGGLRKELPVTYWTFLIGTLAIAGVPLLSGFFSKDEILYQTFASGHHVLWALGVVTAFLTATYMFRLLYLAFFGERRGAAVTAAPAAPREDSESAPAAGAGVGPRANEVTSAGARASGGGAPLAVNIGGPATPARHDHTDAHHAPAHSAPHGLHDAPPAMAIALVVLALGSVVAGYVGVPNVLMHGGNRIEAFLEPSFRVAGAVETVPASPAETEGSSSTEMALMGISTLVALAGIGLATVIYRRDSGLSDRIAASFGPLHRLLLGKYFVDEAYDAVIVQPVKRASTTLLWRGADAGLIDGTVNGVGLVVRGWSAVLRRLQTGSVRAYAMSVFVGVVVMLGYYLWVTPR